MAVRQEQRDAGRRPLAEAGLVGIAAIWGVTFPMVHAAVAHVPPLPFLVCRFLFASALLLPIAWLRVGLRPLLRPAAIAPGVCLAAGYWLQTEGLRSVSPSVSAFITGTSVVLVPSLGGVIGWERAGPRRWAGALLALVGVGALQGRMPDRWTAGETWTILCAAAFALQILLIGRFGSRREDPLALGTAQIVVAAVLLLAVGLLRAGGTGLCGAGASVWIAAAFTGIFATSIAFVGQTWAQQRVPAGHVAICYSTEPLFAVLFSVGFCGDSMPLRGWLGAAAILGAILIVTTESIGGGDRRSLGR